MNERIEINPLVCHGSPVIRGTRILVSQILGALSGGDSINDVLEDYPSITSEDISAVLDTRQSALMKPANRAMMMRRYFRLRSDWAL